MTKNDACKASCADRYYKIRSNTSTLRTSVRKIMDLNTVSVKHANFFDIQRRLLVIIEQAPQLVYSRAVLREHYLASCGNQEQ